MASCKLTSLLFLVELWALLCLILCVSSFIPCELEPNTVIPVISGFYCLTSTLPLGTTNASKFNSVQNIHYSRSITRSTAHVLPALHGYHSSHSAGYLPSGYHVIHAGLTQPNLRARSGYPTYPNFLHSRRALPEYAVISFDTNVLLSSVHISTAKPSQNLVNCQDYILSTPFVTTSLTFPNPAKPSLFCVSFLRRMRDCEIVGFLHNLLQIFCNTLRGISRGHIASALTQLHQNFLNWCICAHAIPRRDAGVTSHIVRLLLRRGSMYKHDFIAALGKQLAARSDSIHCPCSSRSSTDYIKSRTARVDIPWFFLFADTLSCFELLLSTSSTRSVRTHFIPQPTVPSTHSYPVGGGRTKIFSFTAEEVDPFMLSDLPGPAKHYTLRYVDHVDSHGLLNYPLADGYAHADMPLRSLVPHLSMTNMIKIARIHGLPVAKKPYLEDLLSLFTGHNCVSCTLYKTVFIITASKASKNNKSRKEKYALLKESKVTVSLSDDGNDPTPFPPPPLTPELSHKIIKEFCAASDTNVLQEAGCAVCGRLVPVTQLSPLKHIKRLLHILEAPGVTRMERTEASQPIRGYKGPVLDYSCNRVCNDCRGAIRGGKIPRFALAKGLWLGKVPEVLSSLNFMEKLLISRVRHTCCYVRVASSGRHKMVAHMVAFESPVPKIYDMLPPPVEDLDDVLAILFTGPCKPNEEDMRRTPVLVRRKAVRAALEWLRLNHPDYADVGISETNLALYPEDQPVVSVVYRDSLTNKIAEATSVHDDGEEEGVDVGDCPFVVHGLTGEQLGATSVDALKGIAMKHWNSRGKVLRVRAGDSSKLQSIYDNPDLYPRMFPWLFPYGAGGVGSTHLSDATHKKYLLMYHDKRFQTDLAFPFAAFSHQQVKKTSTSSFLCAEAANFQQISDRLLNVNQDVLTNIAQRMARGDIVKPQTEEEKNCFQVIRDLDHVGGRVDGSIASKKHMKNEIWSLIANQGAPSWYITLSPADLCHPICLYFADNKETFEPVIRTGDDRFRLIAQNPVAAARFFDFMVRLFIKHVLGFDSDHDGLYGDTSAYYGTVEQQGRLTLHLHLLLWIRNGLTPDDARKLIMDPSSPFQRELVQYLEAACQGEFKTGTMDDVRASVEAASALPDYCKPTESLPEPPPEQCPAKCDEPHCDRCQRLKSWWSRFDFTVDDILFKSNVHTCRSTVNKDGSQNKKKQYTGCIDNKWGVCRARFPRPTFKQSEVDPASGSLHIKKLESWMNTFSYVLTYLFRCNTDVTSMRSGTAIKGVLHYVTKYITKSSLKTHVIFETVRSMFHKNAEVLGGTAARTEKARKLMTSIVNCLGVKSEMGSPMMCMYLLRNPDHYTSHKFKPFYWQEFVREAMSAWPGQDSSSLQSPQKVVLIQRNGRVIGLSPVYDYIFRSPELESLCLYDWVARCKRIKGCQETPDADDNDLHDDTQGFDDTAQHKPDHPHAEEWPEGGGINQKKTKKRAETSVHAFLDDHPLASTHNTVCVDLKHGVVPNFIGRSLPRRDQGDREFYCVTMLALFKPWRSGLDLKKKEPSPFVPDAGINGEDGSADVEFSSWDEAFVGTKFIPRHETMMKNFNIQYECMDAQDDFHAQMKKGSVNLPGSTDSHISYMANFQQDQQIDDFTFDEANVDRHEILETENAAHGHLSVMAAIRDMSGIMRNNDWHILQPDLLPDDTNLTPQPPSLQQPGSMWKASVANKRAEILELRAKNLPGSLTNNFRIPDVVDIIDKSFLNKKCKSGKWASAIEEIVLDFNLNKEQRRAFSIVANHAANPGSDQLKMYIGGMGGTGKTQVLRALVKYFEMRKEAHRIVVVAPTGTAASLLGGSTYHYMFGICDIDGERNNTQLSQVKSRLTGVDYVFFDEVSMLSCRDLYRISARLAHVLANAECPFGGMNMIFAGDFAQLPPPLGGESISLYSRTVGGSVVSLQNQESAIGKALWHQITTVVILRQNMRQKTQSAQDTKLRTALENMRYKSCTLEDLIFLRSRISSNSPGRSSITEKQFRNVSIITAVNRNKDAINSLGSERFANETNQTLTHFYSEDLLTPPLDDEVRKHRKAANIRTRIQKTMPSEKDQMALWESPHCRNSKQIPGKLSLCIGLPVMIRHNSATELCMTRGQEGFVHSWQASKGARGQRVLDTLFVRLSKPPRPVQIEGLLENIVPITRTTVSTMCSLPDDSVVSVSRTQVEVLPNFSMTDYASQGKTRDSNVVHLTDCRTHQAYYTALSRGVSADRTLILQGFDSTKVTGGASGALRQEFRELELLDNITYLRYEGKLPKGMHDAERRNTLIDSFRSCKGATYMPPSLHRAVRWSRSDPFLGWVLEDVNWEIVTKESVDSAPVPKSNFVPARGTTRALQQDLIRTGSMKRKLADVDGSDHDDDMPDFKKPKSAYVAVPQNPGNPQDPQSPIGPIWRDNSCAYDATVSLLHNVWCEYPHIMTELVTFCSPEFIRPLVAQFLLAAASQPVRLEGARDHLRRALFTKSPTAFPWGRYTSVHTMFDYVFDSTVQVMSSKLTCPNRHRVNRIVSPISGCYFIPVTSAGTSLQTYVDNFHYEAGSRCRTCQNPLIMVHAFIHAPPILVFDLTRGSPSFTWNLTISVSSQRSRRRQVAYHLSAVVYHGGEHFVCRVISPANTHTVWNHDGMTTGASMQPEGSAMDTRSLVSLGTRNAIIAVYARLS